MEQNGNWYATVTPDNQKLYNGKEFNRDWDINLNDHGARWYDPALGRFIAVDPLSEAAPSWTPYRFGFDNPIKYSDPTGKLESGQYGYEEYEGNVSIGFGRNGSVVVSGGDKNSDEECCPDGGIEWRHNHRNERLLKGEITLDEWFEEVKAEANGAVEGITWWLGGEAIVIIVKGGRVFFYAYKGRKLTRIRKAATVAKSATKKVPTDVAEEAVKHITADNLEKAIKVLRSSDKVDKSIVKNLDQISKNLKVNLDEWRLGLRTIEQHNVTRTQQVRELLKILRPEHFQ